MLFIETLCQPGASTTAPAAVDLARQLSNAAAGPGEPLVHMRSSRLRELGKALWSRGMLRPCRPHRADMARIEMPVWLQGLAAARQASALPGLLHAPWTLSRRSPRRWGSRL